MGDEAKRFPEAVWRLRKRLGCSQAVFAEAVGLNVRSLQNWEIGRVVPEYHSLILSGLEQRVAKLAAKGLPKQKNRRRRHV